MIPAASAELLLANLSSPVVLAFVLGALARWLRSDLEIPAPIQSYLSIFLLLAIGLKGGVALRTQDPATVLALIAATIALGIVTTLTAWLAARLLLRDGRVQAGAMAAHYGSVSAVTFIAAQQFTERGANPAEGVLVALVVALEIPAILLGLALAQGRAGLRGPALREVLVGRTAVLLVGGLVIGALGSRAGIDAVDNMYVQLFQGTLMLFMLDMGMLAASRRREIRADAVRLVLYATAVPLLHGLFGAMVGVACGLSAAGATVFATMAASASYIAAPAAVRASLPEADAARCIAASLAITFPFNLAIGIPLYSAWVGFVLRQQGG